MANERQITSSSAYVETEPTDERQVTSTSAYIETEPINTRQVTSVSAYIEWFPPPTPMTPLVVTNYEHRSLITSYDVWLTDELGKNIQKIDDYRSISLGRQINDVGVFEITIPGSYPKSLFKVDRRFEIYRKTSDLPSTLEGDTCWFIRRIEDVLDDDGNEFYLIKAYDANHLLTRRIVPYNAGNSNLNADKVQEADDMMKAIVRENYGTDALDTARDLSDWLTVAEDVTLAPQVNKSFSRKVVIDVLQDIAKTSYEYGTYLAFDIIYSPDTKKFYFRTYVKQRGTDRTVTSGKNVLIVGPEFGTLRDVSVVEDQTDTYNYVYAGGASIGDIRAVYEVYDTASINISPFNRIEHFTNASNTDDLDELETEANSSLEDGRYRTKFSGKLDLGTNILYGVDIKFGDKVTAEYKGLRYDVWLAAYELKVSGSKDEITIALKSD